MAKYEDLPTYRGRIEVKLYVDVPLEARDDEEAERLMVKEAEELEIRITAGDPEADYEYDWEHGEGSPKVLECHREDEKS